MHKTLEAIIFDLDGTAVPNAGQTPSAVMCQAVQRHNARLKLCAATGRSWPEAQAVFKSLGLTQPSILCGGTMIVDPVQESILWQETFDARVLKSILEIVKQYPYKVIYAEGLTNSDRISPSEVGSLDRLNIFYVIDIPADHPDLGRLISDLSQIEGVAVSRASAWGLQDGIDLHITSQAATKEHAVIELCEMLNVDRSKTAGVGDGYNDLHLFNAVGYKIAMGNAVAQLKEAADEVILPVEEDGLAHFIDLSVN